MNNPTELQKLISLLMHIQDSYAAEVRQGVDWPRREWVIAVDESGKTVYAATLQLDGAIEAKCRLVRFELEQMIEECELPILHVEAA